MLTGKNCSALNSNVFIKILFLLKIRYGGIIGFGLASKSSNLIKSRSYMKKIAFKMHLHKGREEEYKRRHDEIPPELTNLLRSAGITDYSIFLDPASGDLFGVMNIKNEEALQHLSQHATMKKWWTMMKDIMDTNEDDSPATIQLKEVFYMK